MNAYILQKEKLTDFLESLKEYEVWAPVQKDATTLFEVIRDFQNISLDLNHQAVISKSAVFPQTETLFTFDHHAAVKETSPKEGMDTVVFGIRPCDARSFQLLDPIFEGDYPDPYYLKRRNKTALIGMACNEPFPNCFCTSINGNPFSKEGLDLLFTALNGSYHIDVITDKGRIMIDKASSHLTTAKAEDTTEKEQLAKAAEGKIKRHINLDGIKDKLAAIFDHAIWNRFASKCIGCGICTYSCPTCYCFDMQDETSERKGRRVRIWDSCMFPEYTLHASGHNPRPTRTQRLRNRMYHKFKFNIDNYGFPSCVGCGRCITLCPVNVDLIENLSAIKELE